MSEQAFQPLLYAISADVVKRLVAGGMNLAAALGAFYSSHLYAALSPGRCACREHDCKADRKCGAWHAR